MGSYTTNSHFYLPAEGETGTTNLALFNAALETLDGVIEDRLLGAAFTNDLLPGTDGTYDLGSSTYEWQDLYIDGTANIDSLVADTADINAGTVDAITSLTVANNVDIGNYDLRCLTITADSLTAGRVPFASTNGQLVDDADFTFATDTLTVTKMAAFELTGKLTAGANEIEGSAFDINGGTVDAITSLTVANAVDIGNYNLRALSLTADSLTAGRVPFASTDGLLVDDADFTFDTATLTVTNIAAFNLTGKLTAGATEIEGSGFDIDGGDISAVTISGGLTWNAAQNLNDQNLTNVDIDSGAIDGTTIGAASAAAATFTNVTVTGLTTGQITFLTAGLTSTSYDGDSFSDSNNLIDTSDTFSAPAGITAAYVTIFCRDSGSSGTDSWVGAAYSSSATNTEQSVIVQLLGHANDQLISGSGWTKCDSNGDFYLNVNASGSSTCDVWLYIWGYAQNPA